MALLLSQVSPLARAEPLAFIGCGLDDAVSIIDTATNTVVSTVPAGASPSPGAAHPDGTRMYLNAGNGVEVIDTRTHEVSPVVDLGIRSDRLVFHPNGKILYAGSGIKATIWQIDTTTNTVEDAVVVGSEFFLSSLTIDSAGKHLYLTGALGVIVVDTSDLSTLTIETWERSFGMAIHPHGRVGDVTNGIGSTISVIDLASNIEVDTISGGSIDGPWGVAVHPDGSALYVSNSAGTVSVIDTETHTIVETVTVGSAPLAFGMLPSADSLYVVNSQSASVSVIDTATNAVVTTIQPCSFIEGFGEFISPPAALFNDGFESGDTTAWTTTNP